MPSRRMRQKTTALSKPRTPSTAFVSQFNGQFWQIMYSDEHKHSTKKSHTLVDFYHGMNLVYEELCRGWDFKVEVSYDQWVSRKNQWDKDWNIENDGPSPEIRRSLEQKPTWLECRDGILQLKPRTLQAPMSVKTIRYQSACLLTTSSVVCPSSKGTSRAPLDCQQNLTSFPAPQQPCLTSHYPSGYDVYIDPSSPSQASPLQSSVYNPRSNTIPAISPHDNVPSSGLSDGYDPQQWPLAFISGKEFDSVDEWNFWPSSTSFGLSRTIDANPPLPDPSLDITPSTYSGNHAGPAVAAAFMDESRESQPLASERSALLDLRPRPTMRQPSGDRKAIITDNKD